MKRYEKHQHKNKMDELRPNMTCDRLFVPSVLWDSSGILRWRFPLISQVQWLLLEILGKVQNRCQRHSNRYWQFQLKGRSTKHRLPLQPPLLLSTLFCRLLPRKNRLIMQGAATSLDLDFALSEESKQSSSSMRATIVARACSLVVPKDFLDQGKICETRINPYLKPVFQPAFMVFIECFSSFVWPQNPVANAVLTIPVLCEQ